MHDKEIKDKTTKLKLSVVEYYESVQIILV